MSNFLAILTTISMMFSFSMRSSNDLSCPFDYEMKLSAEKDKVFSISMEKERENGYYFTNSEIMLQKEWKYFLIRGKSIDIQSRNIAIREINFLLRYKHSFAGIVAVWQDLTPSQAFKIGIEYTKEINLLLSQPKLKVSSFISTEDFKTFSKTFSGVAKFNLFTFGKLVDVDFFMKTEILQYKTLDWQYKTGIEVKF